MDKEHPLELVTNGDQHHFTVRIYLATYCRSIRVVAAEVGIGARLTI
jgi:hypothetical protein